MKHQNLTSSKDDLTARFKSTNATLKSLSSLSSLRSTLSSLLISLDVPSPSIPSARLDSVGETVVINASNVGGLDKLVPALQTVLVEWVLPNWWDAIREDKSARGLVEGCFAPPVHGDGSRGIDGYEEDRSVEEVQTASSQSTRYKLRSQVRNKIITSAHLILSTSISSPSTPHVSLPPLIDLTGQLSSQTSLTEVYSQLYPPRVADAQSFGSGREVYARSDLMWTELIKSWTSWPARVGNAWGRFQEGGKKGGGEPWDIPESLRSRPYFDRLAQQTEDLAFRLRLSSIVDLEPLRDLLVKLHRVGLLNQPAPRMEHSPSPSFFTPTTTSLIRRLSHPGGDRSSDKYPVDFWPLILSELPQATHQAYLHSLFLHLTYHLATLTLPISPPTPSGTIRAAASLLALFGGKAIPGDETWRVLVTGIVLGRNGVVRDVAIISTPEAASTVEGRSSGEEVARVVVAWAATGGEKAIKAFLTDVIGSWGDSREIKYTTYGRQIFLTNLLVLTLSQLRPMHPVITTLAFDSTVLQSIQHYLSHSDPAIRRLGMLVAEIISQLSVPNAASSAAFNEQGSKVETDADLQKELEALLGEIEQDEGGSGTARKPSPPSGGREMKRLDFGKEMWEGKGQGREECRRLRSFLGIRDSTIALAEIPAASWELGWSPAIIDSTDDVTAAANLVPSKSAASQPRSSVQLDRGRSTSKAKPTKAKSTPKPQVAVDSDDDSLIGYSTASSPSSSRSPSPTPSYLAEIAADPSLHTSNRAKVQRPVYITQLLDLLRASKEPDKLEVALRWGESLIRRKREFGGELQENAVALGVQILNLNDNYNLDEFEEKRQGMLIALTASCPQSVAPFLAQQYFEGEYSLLQRTTILSALAMGARELAGLATVRSASLPSVDFPSKMMPGKMHWRYVTAADSRPGALETAAGEVRKEVMDNAKIGTANMVPKELVRTRRFRPIGATAKGKIQEVDGTGHGVTPPDHDDRFSLTARAGPSMPTPIIPYSDVAGEHFILPMINRFWIHFQDEATRESRTRRAFGGTGMVLSPLAMSKYLATLSIMVHAGRHSSLFLGVIAPEGLELAVTVGSRLAQRPEAVQLSGPASDEKEYESDVVCAALELALVCLDGSKELDDGRTLALDKGTILMAAGEWASGLFELERKGEQAAVNGGGQREGRTRKAAAGVVVLVAGMIERMQGQRSG